MDDLLRVVELSLATPLVVAVAGWASHGKSRWIAHLSAVLARTTVAIMTLHVGWYLAANIVVTTAFVALLRTVRGVAILHLMVSAIEWTTAVALIALAFWLGGWARAAGM